MSIAQGKKQAVACRVPSQKAACSHFRPKQKIEFPFRHKQWQYKQWQFVFQAGPSSSKVR
jgi:hypothetical protein